MNRWGKKMVAVYDVLRSDMDRWWTTDEILRTLGDWPPTPSQREIVRRAIHLLAEDEVALVRLGKPLRVLGKPVPVANSERFWAEKHRQRHLPADSGPVVGGAL